MALILIKGCSITIESGDAFVYCLCCYLQFDNGIDLLVDALMEKAEEPDGQEIYDAICDSSISYLQSSVSFGENLEVFALQSYAKYVVVEKTEKLRIILQHERLLHAIHISEDFGLSENFQQSICLLELDRTQQLL